MTVNIDNAVKLDTKTLCDLGQAMRASGVKAYLSGSMCWEGTVCIAWSKDRHNTYRYLYVKKG
jgi:hypothetical protein